MCSLDYENVSLNADIHHLPPPSRFSVNLERLYTVGLHIGTVVATSQDVFYDSDAPTMTRRNFLVSLRKFYTDVLVPWGISAKSYKAAFTLVNDQIDAEALQALISEHFTVQQIMCNQQDLPTSALLQRTLNALGNLTAQGDRIIFITEQGHCGALYHPNPRTALQPGDIVVGLFGLNVPFALRPLPRTDSEEERYAMINLAFVAGHEYGHEFVKSSGPGTKWKDFEKLGLREYCIV
jgi:hypothetical protein